MRLLSKKNEFHEITGGNHLQGKKTLETEEVFIRGSLYLHQVRVKLVTSGPCHTDILVHDAPSHFPLMLQPPMPGHQQIQQSLMTQENWHAG